MVIVTALISLALGGYLGARYGRALEQSAVHQALDDLSIVDGVAIAAFRAKLSTRLTYLKKSS